MLYKLYLNKAVINTKKGFKVWMMKARNCDEGTEIVLLQIIIKKEEKEQCRKS